MPVDSRRKTIAVLIDHSDHQTGGYEGQLRAAFEASCRKIDANLLIVAGRWLDSSVPSHRAHNVVYDLIGPESADGVVFISGLASECGVERLARFCETYRSLAWCSLGLEVPAVPSIIVDNEPGMRAALDHVLVDHGCRTVAFLGGPATNIDAQVRLDVYRDALARHGIPWDPSIVRSAEFSYEHGIEMTAAVLSGARKIDAVVCGNDNIASGALEALARRGLRAPRDVLVTGFDDQLIARLADPPLSTVRQPLHRMATLAVDLVADQIAGHEVPAITRLPSEFVARGSCGCGSISASAASLPPRSVSSDPAEYVRNNAARLTRLFAAMVRSDEGQCPDAPSALLAALEAALAGREGPWGSVVQGVLDVTGDDNERYEDFQTGISALRDELLPFASSPDLERLWHDSRRRIASANMRAQVRQRMRVESTYTGLVRTGEKLARVLDRPALKRALDEELPVAGINSAVIALFSEDDPAQLEPFVCQRDGVSYDPLARCYPAKQLLPPGALTPDRRHTLFVLPLTVEEERLGVAAFELEIYSAIYEVLRGQISSSLKTTALHHEIVSRTAAHERSVQERIATAERLRSLSLLAGGVAHDLNNSIGPLVALPDVIMQELVGIEPRLWPELEEVLADLTTMKAAALRASNTIKDLLTLGRQGQTSKDALDLNQAVAGCMAAQPERFLVAAEPGVRISVELDPGPLIIDASEAHIVRAVTNLVRNAAEAITGAGQVVVSTSRTTLAEPLSGYELIDPGDYAVLTVNDTGEGIPGDMLGRIFEPFFSSKQLEEQSGSGLGLAIVHGVVKEHGGFVNVQSIVGKGTTFTLYFPRLSGRRQRAGEPSIMPRGSARVLVIDDDPIQLRTARRVLSRLGYEVTVVDSSAKAQELFADGPTAPGLDGVATTLRSPYDLVLVDMNLHEAEDGLSVFERIRRRYPLQRGILVSGQAPTARSEQATKRGLIWLSKPYSARLLARTVQVALARSLEPGVPPPAS